MANTTVTPPQNKFDIPPGGYVAFDAMSLRQLIIDRLNEQNVFTDQNYIGSNLASIIDIVSYSYNTLIYYLNKTSNEAMFTEAQLYENINRIVKLIDYSPVGFQTSTLTFNCSASNLPIGLHTIPRYTYLTTNNIVYSFNKDITFAKTADGIIEPLTILSQNNLLYQGRYIEHPTYSAAGDSNELIIVNPGNNVPDHFNFDVFVKPAATGIWEQFTNTPNLFLEKGSAKKYQIRLNQNYNYEIMFGDDINGIKLKTGDLVGIYYIASSGKAGEIGPNTIDKSVLATFNTIQFNQIKNDIFINKYNYLTNITLNNLSFTNTSNSTPFNQPESPDDIRKTAPANYRSQFRLVTTNDYETFVNTNYSNLISDVKCLNNNDYIAGYLQYYYNIGITNPNLTERALFNQVYYSDACNFNNIYLLVVPQSSNTKPTYLLPAQKQLIKAGISTNNVTTTETVFIDPVFKAVGIGISSSASTLSPTTDESLCYLDVHKVPSSLRNNQSIINDIVKIFTNYFSVNNNSLGRTIGTRQLTQQILDVDGVQTFYTTRKDDSTILTEGLSLVVYNPIYPVADNKFITNNLVMQNFEYTYFNNIDTLVNKIVIASPTNLKQTVL